MFSVILPVYNGEKFVEKAIESVFAQSFSDWELIIVNDGSKDNTAAVLEKYENNPKIRIFTKENGGVSAARNLGMDKASGSHFAFIDADDIWMENHLEIMHELINKYPDAGIYGTFTAVELVNGEKIEKCSFFEGREETVYLPDFFLEYHKDKSAKMFTVITTCFSAEAIKKCGGFPVGCAIGEDLELSLRVAAYFPAVLTSRATAVYQKSNSTATKDISFDPDWGFFEGVKEILKDEEIPDGKRENLRKVMEWFSMRRVRHYLIDGKRKKAFEIHKKTDKSCISLKDNIINSVLLMLPAFAVKKIFMARWRGKA